MMKYLPKNVREKYSYTPESTPSTQKILDDIKLYFRLKVETNRLLYLIFYIICTQFLAGICELTGWLICIYTEISII